MKRFTSVFVFLTVVFMLAGNVDVFGQSNQKVGFTIGISTNGWEPFIGLDVVTENIDYSLTVSTSFSTHSDIWLRASFSVIPHISSFETKTVGIPIGLSLAMNRWDEHWLWFGLKSGVRVYDSITDKVILFYGIDGGLVSFKTDNFIFGFFDWGSIEAGTRLLF